MEEPKDYKKASYNGIPCYFNVETNDMIARGWLSGIALSVQLWIDVHILNVEGFDIKVYDED